jgi:hypothetical protein
MGRKTRREFMQMLGLAAASAGASEARKKSDH